MRWWITRQDRPSYGGHAPRQRARVLLAGAAVALLALGTAGGIWRVLWLERGELDERTPWQPLASAPSAAEGGDGASTRRRLATVALRAGESVEVELCSRDGFPPERWSGRAVVEVYHLEPREQLVSTPIDGDVLQRVRRGRAGGCVDVAEGSALPHDGRFAVEVAWRAGALPSAAARSPVQARVAAWRPLAQREGLVVLAGLMGTLLSWVALVTAGRGVGGATPNGTATDGAAPSSAPAGDVPGAGRPFLRLMLGTILLLGAGLALSLVPVGGSTFGLVQGLLLAGVQVAVAFALLPRDAPKLQALALRGPVRPWWALLLAPVAGLVARFGGGLMMRLVPATGEAPITAFAAMPSGALAVAVVAVVVPLAEEAFFRGFLYGMAERRLGPGGAVALTTVLFTVAHLPQLWGSWGSLGSIALTGLILAALRRAFGSTLVPALAHVTHNGVIVAATLSG